MRTLKMILKFVIMLIFLPFGLLGLLMTITEFDGLNLFLTIILLAVGVPATLSFWKDFKPYLKEASEMHKEIKTQIAEKKQYVKPVYSDEEVLDYVKSLPGQKTTERFDVGRESFPTRTRRSYAPEPIFENFVVVDLETTGLSPSTDRIIEIAAVKIKEEQIVDRFSTLVNPLIGIPPHITKLTGITPLMVKDAPPINSVINNFWDFTEGLPLVAHNASFEAGFLEAASSVGTSSLYVDTLKFARWYFGDLPDHKLATLCDHLEIFNDSQHRAMGDCLATVEVYNRCKTLYEKENRIVFAKQYEKEGHIEKAIELYELLIEDDFEGNHPYDRLAILYRKNKQYHDEVRVLLKAIDVFENKINPERADREPKLEKFKIRLGKAEILRNKNVSEGKVSMIEKS